MSSPQPSAGAEKDLARSGERPESEIQQLNASIALLRATLEATADGVLATNHAGVITDFNQKYLQMWGLTREQLVSRAHRDVLPFIARQFRDPVAFIARVETIYASSAPETFDVLELADGRVFERISKLTMEQGVVGRVWSFRDTTEKVRAQEMLKDQSLLLKAKVAQRTAELQRTELQFKQLVNGISDYAVYMLDPTGRVMSWNPGAERIKGYTEDEIIGRNFAAFYTDEDQAAGKPARALAIAAREGKYEAEGWRVRKDGTRFWASVAVDCIRGAEGQTIGFAKITRDMTERRAMQEQLHQSQKMEAIGQLTGGVAHDFNNLLTVILGNLDTVWRHVKIEDARVRRAIDQATRGAERAAALTQQLLAFSRRQPLNPKPTDVNRLVTGMKDLVRRTLTEAITIKTELADDLWRVEVDAHQLESALLNLAVNARDAMPNGGKLTIETSNVDIDAGSAASYGDISPGPYVLISLSDTGVGMTGEVLAHAFDPFFTTKPVGQGTGLGLSQVFGFVKQSGGHVKLYSEVGRGATVKIYLPRISADAAPMDPEPASAEVKRGGGETVLVVEDDEDVRIYSTESLRELGFNVLEAQDGESALHILEQHPEIALLFTDVGLPGLNGRELVEQAQVRRPGLRVLFTSGYARSAIVHQGRLDPGVELLTKPFTRAQLATRVREVLDAALQKPAIERVALVVEDEALVRLFLVDILEEDGYTVVQAGTARDGVEALHRLDRIEAAFIDIGLPDRNGLELAAEVLKLRPDLKIAIASGYSDAGGRLRDDRRVTFIRKPFDAAAVRAALDALNAQAANS